jgi:tetratricopeptide (TPR) repeat protein
MSAAKSLRPLACRGLVAVLAIAACKPGETETPGSAERGAKSKRQKGTADESAKKIVPSVQDRDPEQERKKMALSRERSAQARTFLQQRRFSEAVAHSREALKIHEQNVDAMLVLAEVYFREQKYELTQAVTTSALAVDPKVRKPTETSDAYNLRGFAYLAMGNPIAATKAFKEAAQADDKNAAAWNNLGARYMASGDVKTALSCFKYALDLDPKFVKAQLNYGAALRAQRKWAEAEAAMLKTLKLQANYAEALFNLGVLYLDADPFPGLDTTQRLNRAIQYLTRYRELAAAGSATSLGGVPLDAKRQTNIVLVESNPIGRERADDYIRVAKKGLEREQKRQDKARKRNQKEAEAGTGASSTPVGQSASGNAAGSSPASATTQQPGQASTERPGPPKQAPAGQPAKPGTAQPPAQPTAPKQAPSQQPQPPTQGPKTQAPKVQAPNAQKPRSK